MAKKIIKAQMKQRLDTSANWAATNPVLLSGELGIVSDDPNLYKIGDGVTHWNDLPFRGFDGTIVHETGQSRNAVMSQAGVTKALELAARFNPAGRYPDMSVGFADNLVGRGESVPAEFSFRATGGKSIQDGAARIKRVKGNSIVWNQKVNPSDVSANNTAISKNGNSVTATLNATSVSKGYGGIGFNLKDSLIADHYYYIHIDDVNYATSISNLTIGNMVKGDILTANGVLTKAFVIKASGSSSPQSIYINAVGNLVSGATFTITGLKCVDLTRMYGAGNEPTTVEDFHSRMPINVDMGAYNEGEVLHMDVDAIKSVGDNAWDGQYDKGYINLSNGNEAMLEGYMRARCLIKVLPNAMYYASLPSGVSDFQVAAYDENGAFLRQLGVSYRQFTTSSDCSYIKFYCRNSLYNAEIMISLVHSGWKQDTDAGYQPFWQDVKSLEVLRKYFPGGMRSAGAAYDEVRFNPASKKWEAVQRVGEVNLGNLTWTAETFNGNQAFRSRGNYLNAQFKDTTDYYICARYESVGKEIYTSGKIGIAVNNGYFDSESAKDFIVVRDTAYSSASAFKSAMAGVMLYFELAQPIVTEIAEDINLDYRVADFGTEEAISSQPSAPFKADIIYQFNAVDMIREHEQEIAQLQAMISAMSAQLASLTNAN